MRSGEVPWLPRLLQGLDLRQTDRCLLVHPPDVATAAAVALAAGRKGELTVAVDRRALGAALATALPQAEVALARLDHAPSLGVFDAVLAVVPGAAGAELQALAAFVARSLRPGGRFVVDLPAPDAWPDLNEAAADARATDSLVALERARGPALDDLLAALRQQGLRRVEPMLGPQLLNFTSPFEAALELGTILQLPEGERQSLALALAHRRQSTGPIEIRALRSSCVGMR